MELLQASLRVTEQEYKDNGKVTWATFFADPETHQKKVVVLSQDDFAHGTIRIKYPCLLLFSEDVAFNPNRPTHNEDGTLDLERSKDWMPYEGQTNEDEYLRGDAAKGYRLGFFAALAIETSKVIVDLAGHTLSQHAEHALMQRFFAAIELADQPFRSSQGPADFGAALASASDTWIKNGCIGLSSHHGIHGNSCRNIWMSDLVFKDSEVASISINGGKVILVERCEDRGRRTDVPVLGSWSALRFATLFAPHLSALDSYSDLVDTPLTNALATVKKVFDLIIVTNDGTIDDSEDLAFLKNESGFLDGPAYGMVFHPEGVAVGPFQTTLGHQTGSIWIKDTVISGVKNASVEIPALDKDGNQVDTVGAVIQIFNGLMDDEGKYTPTVLSALQFAFGALKEVNPDAASYFGTLRIDSNLLDWSQDSSISLSLNEELTEATLTNGTTFAVRHNGDSMHHVIKGVVGLRIEGATEVDLNNLTVQEVSNEGQLGAGVYLKGHEGQKDMVGFWGTVSHGIRISGCSSLKLTNVNVSQVSSLRGPAHGIGIHASSGATLHRVNIEGVHGAPDEDFYLDNTNGQPNPLPTATGLVVDTTAFCKLSNIRARDLSQSSPFSSPQGIELVLENLQKLT